MLRPWTILLIAIILMHNSFAVAKEDFTVLDKDQSEFSIKLDTLKECTPYIVEKYARNHLYKAKENEFYLIKQYFEIGKGCFEGYKPDKIKVRSYRLDNRSGKISKKARWTINSSGALGEAEERPYWGVYHIYDPGCCGAPDINKYFSLNSGKVIVVTTQDLVKIHNAETRDSRFVGIEDFISTPASENSHIIATIYYSDTDGTEQRLWLSNVIKDQKKVDFQYYAFRLVDIDISGNKPQGKEITIFNKKTFTELEVHLKFECLCDEKPFVVTIPILNDHIDIGSVKSDSVYDIKLEEAKLENREQ